MRLHADFSKPALVIPRDDEWVCSPESGVERLMFDRIGEEVARATSLVRYAPGSRFARHVHEKGEEFLVLDGVFSDESGDYPAGTYVRNPPGSAHAPSCRDGCRIFVKLRQFDPGDLEHVVVDIHNGSNWQKTEAGESLHLHRFGKECVEMRRIKAAETLSGIAPQGGTEILLVSGAMSHADHELTPESWLRLPAGSVYDLQARTECQVWMKSGHLPAA